MSLETRLAALITAIGVDIKAINDSLGVLPYFSKYRNTIELFDDFVGSHLAVYGVSTGGTAAAVAAITLPDSTSQGTSQLTTGTTATGRSAIRGGVTGAVRLGLGKTYFTARIRIPTLSDATNRYVLRVGFGDNDSADMVDGVYFEYDDSASAFWRTKSSSNSVRTIINSSVTVAINTWYRLDIEVNDAGDEAKFYIDDVLVATHNAANGYNIPTGAGRETSVGTFVIKSIGTTARTILLDWMGMRMELTTPR